MASAAASAASRRSSTATDCEAPSESREELQLSLSVTKRELLNCSLPAWYSNFQDITIPSVLIPLPPDFVAYLDSDGPLLLPQNCDLPGHAPSGDPIGSDSDSDSRNAESWSSSEEDESDVEAPSFPELLSEITAAIDSLGGAVFPKLDWSSPRDATWISPSNSLQCTSPAEVILLLKSSEFVSHDLSRAFEYCCDEPDSASEPHAHTLCLRKWVVIHPSAEFRCFVVENRLVGICQRDHTAFFPHVVADQTTLWADIVNFFRSKIDGHFPNRSYVFDIYHCSKGVFRLVDFNPYCRMTDGLLFSWEELSLPLGDLYSCGELPVLRVVEGGSSMHASHLHQFRLPKDIVDVSSGEDIHKFTDLFNTQDDKDGDGA